jgi:uncharacterized protein involved in exopolysaccharide biosynthesis
MKQTRLPPRTGFRHARGALLLAAASAFAIGTVVGIGTFFIRPQYRASARFSPEGSSSKQLPGSLSELASQFSLDIGSQGLKPLQYYSVVLRSDAVLDQLLDSDLRLPNYPPTLWAYLAKFLTYRDSLPRERVRKWVRDRVAVTIDFRATTMEVGVTLPDRRVAARATNLLLDALNRFNTSKRVSQARARREYLEGALAVQRDSLKDAENSLQAFLEGNRQYKDAPALEFIQSRLRRQVDMNVQIVSGLQRDLQAARLDEINSTPLLSVIDSAVPPLRPTSPRRARTAGFGAVVAGAAGLYFVLLGLSQARPRHGFRAWSAVVAARLERRTRRIGRHLLPRKRSQRLDDGAGLAT